MTKYQLLKKDGKPFYEIIIDSDDKKDFKELMEWDEKDWEEKTCWYMD